MAPYQLCLSNFVARASPVHYLDVLRSSPTLGIECHNKSQAQSSQSLVPQMNTSNLYIKAMIITSIKRVEAGSSGQRFALLKTPEIKQFILKSSSSHLELDFSRNVYVEQMNFSMHSHQISYSIVRSTSKINKW
jgi:hypothetical protein